MQAPAKSTSAEMTIRSDGTASFTALVSSLDTDDSYCVILDFFDRNQLQLFHFPRICSLWYRSRHGFDAKTPRPELSPVHGDWRFCNSCRVLFQ